MIADPAKKGAMQKDMAMLASVKPVVRTRRPGAAAAAAAAAEAAKPPADKKQP
jgi:hypothetical protein